jgi:hypothetical protein
MWHMTGPDPILLTMANGLSIGRVPRVTDKMLDRPNHLKHGHHPAEHMYQAYARRLTGL